MKILTASLITCGLMVTASAEMRTFTSADGSKTLEATPLDYQPSKGLATIKLKSGRTMNVPVKSFVADDKAYLDNWYASTQAGRKLSISIDDEEIKTGERTENNGKVKTIDARYVLNVRNNGGVDLEDIEVKYRVFYTRDGVDGKKSEDLSLDGEDTISSISSREDIRVMTEPAKLINVRPLPASQCKGGT